MVDGKNDIATPQGRDQRRYGFELAERGYVVLAPDSITAGERVAAGDQPFSTARFVAEHPTLSPIGKMLADHRQAISVLGTIDGVDPLRLGVIGHSLGGYNGWFLAGVDERVAAVVSSCGFATFAGDRDLHRWGKRGWFSHFPALSRDLDAGLVPFEFHEIAALVAPRPFFSWIVVDDEYFPHGDSSILGICEVARVYQAVGQPSSLVSRVGRGGHAFPLEIREAAYAFLDLHLRPVVNP